MVGGSTCITFALHEPLGEGLVESPKFDLDLRPQNWIVFG